MRTASATKSPILMTLPISLFNDFARWSLESCRVDYEEKPQALMFHALASRAKGGAGTTPALFADDQKLTDSLAIAEWADAMAPDGGHIYPQEPEAREEARAFVEQVTGDFALATRRMAWEFLPEDMPTVVRLWSPGVPEWQRRLMPAMLRTGKPMIKQALGLSKEQLAAAPGEVRAGLDAVAERLADGRPYLGGERFGVHDIAFAAMASPAVCPTEGHPVPHFQPEDFPEVHAERIRTFREHPAGAYALRMYSEHRAPATPGSYA